MPTAPHDSLSARSTQLPVLAGSAWEEEVLSQLPATYQQQAHTLGAFVRVRGVRCAGDLLRGLLAYVLCAPSFRQLGLWGVLAQVADLSHVAWHKRLHKARSWLLWLLIELLAVSAPAFPRPLPIKRIVLIDATRLKAPGGTGDDWRAHLSYDLLAGRLLDVKVTDRHTAEGFTLLLLQPGDLVVSDRGYCRRKQLVSVCRCGAFLLVRLAVRQVPLFDQASEPFDVLAWLKQLGPGRHAARVAFEYEGQHIACRLIACSLPEEQAERARAKERKKAAKQQRQLRQDTLYLCGWLLLISTVPEPLFSDEHLLALYRARWQVELLIKRLKQLLKLAQLRGRTEASHEATLLAVLLAFALVQREAARLREELTQALSQWVTAHTASPAGAQDRLASAASPPCVSSWAVLALGVHTLRMSVAGHWSFARLYACLPQLCRHLCSRTGKRGHQESRIRRQMLALLSPDLPDSSLLFCCSSA